MTLNRDIDNYHHIHYNGFFYFHWRYGPYWARASSLSRLHDYTHTTLGRTPLHELSTLGRDLCLTTRKTHNRQISMPPGGIRTA